MYLSFTTLDIIEYIAIITSLGYVILSSRQLIGSWLCGFIGSVLYVFVFYCNGLYGSSLLSCLFTILMIYGWFAWQNNTEEQGLTVTSLDNKQRFLAIGCSIALSTIIFCISISIEGHEFPLEDASIAGFSLVAQVLVARKKLEAWYAWIVINLLAVYTYASTHLIMTALLYAVYSALSFYGLYKWRTSMSAKQ